MALRKCTPCDCDGICPYEAEYNRDCEYWCGADEPEDNIDWDFYYDPEYVEDVADAEE